MNASRVAAKRIFSSLYLLLLISPCFLYSQETTGNIDGRVTDSLGAPVSGALVIARSADLQGRRGTVSDDGGRFRFQALPVGEYSVRISHVAYREVTVQPV